MARDEKTAGSAPSGGSRRLGGLRRPGVAGAAKGKAGSVAVTGKGAAGTGAGSKGAGSKGAGGKAAGKGSGAAPRKPKVPRAARWAARRERLTQFKTAFTLTRKADPRLVPILLACFLVPFVLLLALGLLISHPVLLGILGLLVGLIVTTAVFGRRAQRNAFSQVEGQAGAAAAVIDNMRGDWRVTPAVGFTREQDFVHRVVGRPGIILVAEGSAARTRSLIVNEKKKLARFVGETPVYEVVVGDGDGQVPLRGLERHFVKLPQNIKPKDVNILDRKLKAMAPALPIPKGPVPGGGRMPRGKMR